MNDEEHMKKIEKEIELKEKAQTIGLTMFVFGGLALITLSLAVYMGVITDKSLDWVIAGMFMTPAVVDFYSERRLTASGIGCIALSISLVVFSIYAIVMYGW